MEYLVTMTTHVPDGTPAQAVQDVRTREAGHSAELAAQGHLLRLWRPPLQPGEWRTLGLFAAGVDDVVRKPVHVREIVARVGAINRRVFGENGNVTIGELRVYFDGREPEVNNKPFPLPRRERRILEFLLRCRGRRVSKTQIFNAVYGLFDEDVDENVIESHISKLRKKLKHRLGFDPIDSKRFLGYCIEK